MQRLSGGAEDGGNRATAADYGGPGSGGPKGDNGSEGGDAVHCLLRG